jgi:hypothetical protein
MIMILGWDELAPPSSTVELAELLAQVSGHWKILQGS